MSFARPIKDKSPNVTNPFSAYHRGTDYGYVNGTPIYASEDGTVTIVKNNETRQWIANSASDPFPHPRALRTEDYGNFVKIGHNSGFETLYAHQKAFSPIVKVGDQVKKGQKIGEVGSTGNSSGNHVHWEIRKNGVVVNPIPLLDKEFDGYFDKPVAVPTITITAKEFETLVFNSSQYDSVCAYFNFKKQPDGKNVSWGEVEKKLNEQRGEIVDLKKQIDRKEDEIGRLKASQPLPEIRVTTPADNGSNNNNHPASVGSTPTVTIKPDYSPKDPKMDTKPIQDLFRAIFEWLRKKGGE